ncbi:Methylglyoxal synthase [Klebsiella pneumoniae]|nr:Methylglyoxal synthase [Klebsiella pneumoniae]
MLMKWVARHQALLAQHILYATGTTGNLVPGYRPEVNAMLSGPMGGDQQVGALISEGKIDVLIFWDPLNAVPRPGCQSVAAPGHRLEHSGRH